MNHIAVERSDYVSHALAGRIRVSLTSEVQAGDLIARHQALNACMRIPQVRESSNLCLVAFRKVDNWAVFGPGSPELNGGGFLLDFAELSGSRKPTPELSRVRREIKKRHICQVGSNGIAYKNGGAAFKFIPS